MVCFVRFLCLVVFQVTKAGCLDSYLRPVKKEDDRPSSFDQEIVKWKFSSPPVCEFLLLDKHPVTAIEGDGLERLIELLEPRYEFVSRAYMQHVCVCTRRAEPEIHFLTLCLSLWVVLYS